MNERKINNKVLYREILDYIMIAVGMLSYCIGWTIFLLPNNITTGGLSGLSSIVFWGTEIPVYITFFFVNLILLTIALKALGAKFFIKTIFGVLMLTAFTTIFRNLFPNPTILENEPFMACIIGGVFCGVGVGFGLSFNGSAGGSDIVAAIINKYRDISLGRVIMLVDMIIVTLSYIVLKSWEQVIYGYVVLIITAFVVDQVVNSGRRSVQLLIMSEKYDEICERITTEPPYRGCTIIEAHGFYTGSNIRLLLVVAKQREASMLYRIIDDIDPNAFVTQSAVMGVYGKGFDKFKLKKHHQNMMKELKSKSNK
ncbi:YitT family protein [Prevotella koreensis]|uniref:YitT family protein n=1 Tax=Prevotella koreensis TaxID=2490854 RepID=A0A3S0PA46_9BACT|nr:YitT family protein [Prevotella koreensis]RUL59010.1 YitT family protein [Prevotella koreensis]